MSTHIIIQARMASTRLPGKVLKTVLGRPLLHYLIERLERVQRADGILLATTCGDADLPLVDFCTQRQIPLFRGSEEDVLSRYFEAARFCEATTVVRVTADCPVIDPTIIDTAIERFQEKRGEVDYLSNTHQRTYPRGMDVEVLAFEALQEAHACAVRRDEREHVTPFIYQRPERYQLDHLCQKKDESGYRLTVDTEEDFEVLQTLIEELYPMKREFGLQEMLDLLEKRPDLVKHNAHIEQKKVQPLLAHLNL